MRTNRIPIAIMRRSCSDSLLTASQSDGVFGSDRLGTEPSNRYLRPMASGNSDVGNRVKPPWRSKGAVNRAGGAIRAKTLTPQHDYLLQALPIRHPSAI